MTITGDMYVLTWDTFMLNVDLHAIFCKKNELLFIIDIVEHESHLGKYFRAFLLHHSLEVFTITYSKSIEDSPWRGTLIKLNK